MIDLDFQWWRDPRGYRIQPAMAGASLVEHTPERAVPVSREREAISPLQKYERLFAAFAKVKDASGLLEFMRHHGPLTKIGLEIDGEDTEEALKHAQAFRDWIALSKKGRAEIGKAIGLDGVIFGRLTAKVRASKGGLIQIALQPESLLGAMWLQLVCLLAGGADILSCPMCSTPFMAGPGTPRRADAQFCCVEHKKKFLSLRRSGTEPR